MTPLTTKHCQNSEDFVSRKNYTTLVVLQLHWTRAIQTVTIWRYSITYLAIAQCSKIGIKNLCGFASKKGQSHMIFFHTLDFFGAGPVWEKFKNSSNVAKIVPFLWIFDHYYNCCHFHLSWLDLLHLSTFWLAQHCHSRLIRIAKTVNFDPQKNQRKVVT